MIITKNSSFSKEEINKRNKIALASLAMDLKRVALGYHRGSVKMGKRFFEEALKRKKEVDSASVKPYLRKLLNEFPSIVNKKEQDIAEDALMYSTLFQNAALKNK